LTGRRGVDEIQAGIPPAIWERNMEKPTFKLPAELAGERILTLAQVTELTTLSADTLSREHGDRIVRLSQRRRGMRLKDALALGKAR
jgi:hypothetical protein